MINLRSQICEVIPSWQLSGLSNEQPLKPFYGTAMFRPIFEHGVCAGFPSPADDYLDENIDLSKLLTPNLPATFFWRVNGHSMRDAGIFDGDMLIVDRSLNASHNDVVVAVVNGEISLKRLLTKNGAKLVCDNQNFPEYKYPENAEIEIWGVVTFNIHSHRNSV